MSNYYYAALNFPASALENVAVVLWLKGNYPGGAMTYDDPEFGLEMAQVSCDTASGGQIDLSDVLDEEHIPYEHFHRDDNAMNEWTVHVRFENGEKVETVITSDEIVERGAFEDIESSILGEVDALGLSDADAYRMVMDKIKRAIILRKAPAMNYVGVSAPTPVIA